MNENNLSIGIITSPLSEASKTPVSNLVSILLPITNNIYFITGNSGSYLFKDSNKIQTYRIKYKLGTNAFAKILKHLYMQYLITRRLIKKRASVDIWFFFIGANTLLLPILVAKILRKQIVLVLPSSSQMLKFANDKFYGPVRILEILNINLADKIILYSPTLVKEYNLEKYRHKMLISHEHFLDFEKFKINKHFNERDNLVGYIGRLSGEKGIMNFVEAIPKILRKRSDIKFLIGGDGELRDQIVAYLKHENLDTEVTMTGWISHEKLPDYLNELKLIVLPSYTEGLPNIMLEAMACGTPVLATPVGAIPDIIKDCNTGFILENNTPECIANNIIRALEYPNLENIEHNGRKLVKEEFKYEVVVEKFRHIINNMKPIKG